jgi:hypothetical protein
MAAADGPEYHCHCKCDNWAGAGNWFHWLPFMANLRAAMLSPQRRHPLLPKSPESLNFSIARCSHSP